MIRTTPPQKLLAKYHLRPHKGLGQNFLSDDTVLSGIADAAGIPQGAPVLEVGPGLGSLTRHLGERADRVVAVELDHDLVPVLRKELADALVPLAVGGVSAPVAVGGYTYILRKDDERKDLSVPLDLVRDEIEGDLRQAAGEARYAAWLRFLATKNTVRVFPLK